MLQHTCIIEHICIAEFSELGGEENKRGKSFELIEL